MKTVKEEGTDEINQVFKNYLRQEKSLHHYRKNVNIILFLKSKNEEWRGQSVAEGQSTFCSTYKSLGLVASTAKNKSHKWKFFKKVNIVQYFYVLKE